MVKAEFSFFQMQVEGGNGYSVELLQPAFGITPERLDAVDMMLTPGKLTRTVVHSEMPIKTDIHQAIIAAPAIRVNHRIGCRSSIAAATVAYTRQQFGTSVSSKYC